MSQQPIEGEKPQAEETATTTDPPEATTTKPESKPETDWEKHAKTWEGRARSNQQQLDQLQQQWGKLAAIFTPEQTDQDAKPEDLIKTLTDRLDRSERTAAINELARRHGITEDADIAILGAVEDVSQREALAVRLKGQSATIPPDPGQGPHPSAQSTEDAEYEKYFPSRK